MLMNISKMAYKEPRPFWVDESVMMYVCEPDFGKVSGHSQLASGLATTLVLDFF